MPIQCTPASFHRFAGTLVLLAGISASAFGQNSEVSSRFHVYSGSTHAHSELTWSHGSQYATGKDGKKPGMTVKDGASYPTAETKPRADWRTVQGPPSEHYAKAKANGYDFYAVTDHSQESAFNPVEPYNSAWVACKQEAREATDAQFAALAGFEFSENDGPGGKGHINVFNSAEYLNALAPGIDLPHLFYQWLKTASPNGEGPVVASFNHPGPTQYGDWSGRDQEVTDIITLLEVINSNKKLHYEAFVTALDRGWKVSPVCGNDNHGFWGIAEATSRTFVLAAGKTKAGILGAMQQRRTYAAMDKNIRCQYTVNGAIMGSTLEGPEVFNFDILINDPDEDDTRDKITKLDVVKDGGAVVETCEPEPSAFVSWRPSIQDNASKYFFVRVWNAGGDDSGTHDATEPVAWLAPVWTGR